VNVRWLSTALLLLAPIAGCGGAPEPARPESTPADQPERPEARAKPAAARRAPGGGPNIQLLAAGRAPRTRLRYAPVALQSETLLVTTHTNVAMGSPDLPGEPIDLPGTSMRMRVTVDSVGPDDEIACRFELLSVDVQSATAPPATAAMLEAATRKLIGSSGRVTLTTRGIVERVSLAVPSGADPATRELLAELDHSVRQIWDPLPEQPVGVGARWHTQSKIVMRGMTIDQIRRYTLLEHAAGTAKLSVIVEQTAKRQPLALPNVPAGASVRLEQLASAGDGQVTVDLSKLVPRESKLNLKTTNIVSITGDGRKELMRSDMQVQLALSAIEGATKSE
jgi:hypothetical protein